MVKASHMKFYASKDRVAVKNGAGIRVGTGKMLDHAPSEESLS